MPTFLYTDIEGSTQLWEKHGDTMGAVLDRHDRILLDALAQHGGRLVRHTGDGLFTVFDQEQARAHLAEAGYPGGRGMPVLTAIIPPWDLEVPPSLFDPWEENLGVKINWTVVEWDVYQERVRTEKIHLFMYGWAAYYPDPDSMLRVGLQVISQWQHEPFSRLVEQARGLRDHDQRMALYRQAEEILVDQAPIMPIVYVRYHGLTKPWVRNYKPSDLSISDYKDVIIDPH